MRLAKALIDRRTAPASSRRRPPRPMGPSRPVRPPAAVRPHGRSALVDPGPNDTARYDCVCGWAFRARVTTSVACPHCGILQAW